MNQLLPCTCCARHVRRTEPRCPFCGAGLAEAFASAPGPRVVPNGLSRAALAALAAASIGSAACNSTTDAPLYGGAPAPTGGSGGTTATGGVTGSGGTATATGGSVAGGPGSGGYIAIDAYGAPLPPEGTGGLGTGGNGGAGPRLDAGEDAAPDAAANATGGTSAALYGAAPLYGLSPPPAK